jgi:RNA polymerase sigma-70 factor (ECF subfamily)
MSNKPSLDYETALLECAAGNNAAAAVIYQGEVPRLRAVAHRILRNRERVDDVIHDAFVQILRDARNFDPQRGSARAWIYRIVYNTALKRFRSKDRELAGDVDTLLAMHDTEQVVERASRAVDYVDLRNCLDALEPRRRASLILAIVDGRTHAEIARYLGVPVGTVKSWIRRELVALRQQLK